MGRPSVESPYAWPYVEALRLDEAMHDLTILATGMYGKPLYPENGAPVRLVVPWKYAYKSIKAIVKIELVSEQPIPFWNHITPEELGFWANVNPDVHRTRWKQGREMRFLGKDPEPILPTLLFNGYGAEVAHLYAGMDLKVNF
jgi:sulfoxide reductase catalytic subunit YedY